MAILATNKSINFTPSAPEAAELLRLLRRYDIGDVMTGMHENQMLIDKPDLAIRQFTPPYHKSAPCI